MHIQKEQKEKLATLMKQSMKLDEGWSHDFDLIGTIFLHRNKPEYSQEKMELLKLAIKAMQEVRPTNADDYLKASIAIGYMECTRDAEALYFYSGFAIDVILEHEKKDFSPPPIIDIN